MSEADKLQELRKMVAETTRLTIKVANQVNSQIPAQWTAMGELRSAVAELTQDVKVTNQNVVAIGESVKDLRNTVDAYIKGVRNGGGAS